MKKYRTSITAHIQKNIFFGLLTIIVVLFALSAFYLWLPKSPKASLEPFLDLRLEGFHPQNLQIFLYLCFALVCPLYALFLASKPIPPEIHELQFPYLYKIRTLLVSYILPFTLAIFLFYPLISSGIPAILLSVWAEAQVSVFFGWHESMLKILIVFFMFMFVHLKIKNDTKLSWFVFIFTILLSCFLFFISFEKFILSVVNLLQKKFVLPTLVFNFRILFLVSILSSTLMCFSFVFSPKKTFYNLNSRVSLKVVWIVFCALFLLQILAWRIINLHSVSFDFSFLWHFNPLFYPFTQVVAGKTLLVDLPSLYGLAPEILLPLFKIIGLSVFKISIVFAIFQVISLTAIFYVLSRVIRNRVILVFVGIALIMLTFYTHAYFSLHIDRYYQYWPLRFVWPAVSILGFYYFFKNKSLRIGMVFSFIGAVALLWNFESGAIIAISFTAFLITQLIISFFRAHDTFILSQSRHWSVRMNLIAIVLHICVIIGVIGIFLSYLSLKAGAPINWKWIFYYQSLFTKYGYGQFYISSSPDLWTIIFCAYFIGLLISLTRMRWGNLKINDGLLFYISILGIGLSNYYIHEGVPYFLIAVSWPALLVAGILTDELIFSIRSRILPLRQLCLPIIGLGLILIPAVRFISGSPKLIRDIKYRYQHRNIDDDNNVSNEIEFIKRNLNGQKECVLLSQLSSVYYAELGLVNPIKGPLIDSLFLKSEQEEYLKQLYNGKYSCVFMDARSGAEIHKFIPIHKILSQYQIKSVNTTYTMIALQYFRREPFENLEQSQQKK